MADLASSPHALPPIRRRDQFAALAYLRWHLFANGFRGKGRSSDVAVRLILFPLLAVLSMLPITAAASIAWYAIKTHHPGAIGLVTWGVFALSALLSINLGQAQLAFDPACLTRYPLTFASYVITRLFLGLLSVSNILSTLSLAAAAIAIGIGRPSLLPIAMFAFGLYAIALMIFTRMAFAWVDRWLATRRTREILTGVVFLFGITAQFINFYITGDSSHQRLHNLAAKYRIVQHLPEFVAFLRQFHWVSNYLPPGLAAAAVTSSIPSHLNPAISLEATGFLLGIVAFGFICLYVFNLRMRTEYRGENLSQADAAAPLPAPVEEAYDPTRDRRNNLRPEIAPDSHSIASSFDVILACARKELIYLRRGSPILFLLLSPLVMVYFFASRLGAMPNMAPLIFPAAVAYSLLGVSGGAYNIFGPDLNGTQMYLLAPIRLRDVIFAKNLVSFLMLAFQVLLTWVIVSISLRPPAASTVVTTFLWVIFAVTINTSIANQRSVTQPARVKSTGKQARPLSAFMSLGVMLLCALVGSIALGLGIYFEEPWLAPGILAVLSIGGISTYLTHLTLLETTTLNHRETLSEELCKV